MKNVILSLEKDHISQRVWHYFMRSNLHGHTQLPCSILSMIEICTQARLNTSFTLVKYMTSSKRQIFSSLSPTLIPLRTHQSSPQCQHTSQIKISTDPIILRVDSLHPEAWNNGQILQTRPLLTLRQLHSYLLRCLKLLLIFSLEYSKQVFDDLNSSYNMKTYGNPSKAACDFIMGKAMQFFTDLLVARMPVVAGANNSIIRQLNDQKFHQRIYQMGKIYKNLSKNHPYISEKRLF